MTESQAQHNQPGDAAWRMIEPYWDAVNIYDTPLSFLQDFAKVPQRAGHLLAVHWCDSEVCNGGFHQLFHNSTGVLAPEAARGFRALGLDRIAGLVEHAIEKLGEPFPRDREERIARLEQLDRGGERRRDADPFDELDDLYYAAKDELHLDEVADRYARGNSR